MKKLRDYKWPILLLFAGSVAIAAGIQQKFPTDLMIFGLSTSTDDKVLEIDTGDGAGNPKITIDMTNKDFDFNKAVNIVDDMLKLGSGVAADQVIEFDIGAGVANPKFKWDNANQTLSFANDGVNFKKLGSGSGSGGGGTNVLAESNFDFETADPPQDWIASGGTFSAETTAPLFGEQSGLWDSNAISQTLDSALAPITTGFLGRQCQVEIEYLYAVGTSGDYKLVVRQFDDSGATEITVLELPLNVATTARKAQQFFDCPDDVADDLKVRIESTVADADPITIDNVFIGTGRNSFQLSQADVYATVRFGGDCSWNTSSSGFLFPVGDASCTIAEQTGTVTVQTDGNGPRPGITLTNAPPGRYEIYFQSQMIWTNDNNSHDGLLAVNGSARAQASHSGPPGSANDRDTAALKVIHSQTDTATIDITWETRDTGGNNYTTGTNTGFTWYIVKRFPLNPSEAITLETSGWFVDGLVYSAISGNPSLGNTNYSTYTSVGDADLALELRPGSQPMEIPCSASNPSTGLTCAAGNENVGIVVDVPTAGLYEFCMQGTYLADYDNDSYHITFQLIETPNNSDSTILQEGGGKLSYQSNSKPASLNRPINVCGTFNFAAPGQKTIRLMREQVFSGAPNGHFLLTSRSGTIGQPDLHFYGYKVNEGMASPIFTAFQDSLAVRPKSTLTNMRIDTGLVGCGTAVISYNPGSWISSNTTNGGGDCTIAFNSPYSVDPVCTSIPGTSGGSNSVSILAVSTSDVRFRVHNSGGSLVTDNIMFICMGEE